MTAALAIGPYRYTPTDAARSLILLGDWWSALHTAPQTAPLASDAGPTGDAGSVPDETTLLGMQLADRLADALGLGHDPAQPIDRELARLGSAASKHTDRFATTLPLMMDAMSEAARTLRALGRIPTQGSGSVVQLNRSNGGVPKTPVAEAEVTFTGLSGDAQRTRYHHGRPWQALCLWSKEVIDMFAAGGHPIMPGSAGENITISGLDWGDVRPGVRLRVGSALCEASLFALPCNKNAQWFRDGDFSLMHHERGPVSRMYATVIEPGRVSTGDTVLLER